MENHFQYSVCTLDIGNAAQFYDCGVVFVHLCLFA